MARGLINWAVLTNFNVSSLRLRLSHDAIQPVSHASLAHGDIRLQDNLVQVLDNILWFSPCLRAKDTTFTEPSQLVAWLL
jgi:hypothetical protein